jgi:REP element-mobilizing transposase RayT
MRIAEAQWHRQSCLCSIVCLCNLLTMTFYRRNLPHWFQPERSVFLTWRLHGSLPATYFERLRLQTNLTDGEKFRSAEKLLDRPSSGPVWLADPRIADCVAQSIRMGAIELRFYDLHSFAVMSNHAHALVTPRVEVRRLTKGLKGTTARLANAILHRTGQPFWQDESFDHWVRNDSQFVRIKNYIEQNPVKAGLVTNPEDWKWSSAYRIRQ